MQAEILAPAVQDAELKTQFAAALLRWPDDYFEAAKSVVPDFGKALQIMNVWPKDAFVLSEKKRLLEELGPRSFLATKEQQAADIYKLATTDPDPDIRLKAHRLYAEVMGNIEKPSAPTVNVAVQQSVMIVKDHGSDEEWEAKAAVNQRTLTNHATC